MMPNDLCDHPLHDTVDWTPGGDEMGWSFRKSIGIGPLRLNLGKRGVGVSTGIPGARVGIESSGRPYFSAGAFGIRYRKSFGQTTKPAGGQYAWTAVVIVTAILIALLFFILRTVR
jgi:hypothetical protein